MARGAARGPARRSAAPTPANRCAGIAAGHPRRLLGSPGRFGRLLPEHVVADHVHHAVRDLLGSINAEAVPEDGQQVGHRPARTAPDRHRAAKRDATSGTTTGRSRRRWRRSRNGHRPRGRPVERQRFPAGSGRNPDPRRSVRYAADSRSFAPSAEPAQPLIWTLRRVPHGFDHVKAADAGCPVSIAQPARFAVWISVAANCSGSTNATVVNGGICCRV